MDEMEHVVSEIEAARGMPQPDTIVVHPKKASKLRSAAMLFAVAAAFGANLNLGAVGAPQRETSREPTTEDLARIERAKAKRARKAAARGAA
jgi:hypothetical protein